MVFRVWPWGIGRLHNEEQLSLLETCARLRQPERLRFPQLLR